MSFSLGAGFSPLALYQWEAAAQDAGVPSEGFRTRGVSFHYLVDSRATVDETILAPEVAGGTVVKEAAAAQWGGYFADPDGYLREVATSA